MVVVTINSRQCFKKLEVVVLMELERLTIAGTKVHTEDEWVASESSSKVFPHFFVNKNIRTKAMV